MKKWVYCLLFLSLKICFEMEALVNKIVELFLSSLNTNNFKVIFSMLNNQKDSLIKQSETLINSMLHYLKEFTEEFEASGYHSGVQYFEERLYLFEILIEQFTYSNANYFWEIMIGLVKWK